MLSFPIIRAVFRKELRELLRDRRSLLVMFGIPLLLYPLLTVVLGNLARSQEKKLKDESAKVLVHGQANAPKLVELLGGRESGILVVSPEGETWPASRPAATQAATRPAAIPGVPPIAATQSVSAEYVATQPAVASIVSTQPGDGAPTAQVPGRALLERGEVDVILEIPEHAEAQALAGGEPQFVYHVDRSRFQKTGAAERKIDKALRDYERWVIEQRLAGRGVPVDVLTPIKTRSEDIATGGQRLGGLMATMLPLFLLVTGTLGAFFPAINATTTERERGTLETLLASPARRTELLIGKSLIVLMGGLITAGLNLVSMAMVMRWLFAGVKGIPGAADLSIDLTSLLLAFAAVVPTLVFITALVMVAGLFARTFQEANSLALPVMLLPLASMAIAMADPPTTTGLLVTPIANTTVLIRDVLTGRWDVGAFLLASGASLLYAGILFSAASRVFNTEQLVNPAWEPLSIKGLKLSGNRKRMKPRLPPIDVSLALVAATTLMMLYIGPSLLGLDLLLIVLIVQLGLIAAPPLLLAWIAKWPFVPTFSLRRAPWSAIGGAVLLGVGLVPVVDLLLLLQRLVWPGSSEQAMFAMRMLVHAIAQYPILMPIAIGVCAGVSEELLYRGPLLSSMVAKVSARTALVVGAVLFAAAHMDPHGFPIRFGLGLLLGYMVWRGGSIWPAIVAHAVYDIAQVGRVSWMIQAHGVDATLAALDNAGGSFGEPAFWGMLAGGVAMCVIAVMLFRRAWCKRTEVSATASVVAV